MSGPGYHGRTHAPGGTDPVPIELSWAQLSSGSQSVTNNGSLVVSWSSFFTNDSSTFAWDSVSDPEGLQILRGGMFVVFLQANALSYSSIPRSTIARLKRLTAGTTSTPLLNFRSDFLDSSNAHQVYMSATNIPTVTSDYWRVEAFLASLGGAFTTNDCYMNVFRIGSSGSLA